MRKVKKKEWLDPFFAEPPFQGSFTQLQTSMSHFNF